MALHDRLPALPQPWLDGAGTMSRFGAAVLDLPADIPGLARFDTDRIGPRDRLAAWSAGGSQLTFPWRADSPRQNAFHARASAHRAGSVVFAWIGASAQRVTRERREIRQSAETYFNIALPLRGELYADHGGQQICAQPGDLTIVDTTRPHVFAYDCTFEQIAIQVPQALWRERYGRRPLPVGRLLPASDPRVFLATQTIHSAFLASAGQGGALVLPVVDTLLAALAGIGDDLAAIATPRRALYERAVALIGARLADSALDGAAVAGELGISRRYLDRIFAAAGTTFGDRVRAMRLARADAELARSGRAVAEIATDCGFVSPAHFSRVYRARYGCSPRKRRSLPVKC